MADIQSRFTDRAKQAMCIATERAVQCGRNHAAPEDLLLALATIELGPGRVALELLGIDIADSVEHLKSLPAESAIEVDQLHQEALSHAKALDHCYIGTEHLTLAVLTSVQSAASEYLQQRGATADKLRIAIKDVLGGPLS